MLKVVGTLTGTRPAGTDQAQLETTPTTGGMRLNLPAAKLLGVTAGQTVRIVLAGEDGQEAIPYLAVGGEGGAKLAYVNSEEKKGKLSFSDAAGYKELGGSSDKSVIYNLEAPVEQDGVFYSKLVHAEDKTKAARAERTPEQKAESAKKRAATLAAKKGNKTEATTATAPRQEARSRYEEF